MSNPYLANSSVWLLFLIHENKLLCDVFRNASTPSTILCIFLKFSSSFSKWLDYMKEQKLQICMLVYSVVLHVINCHVLILTGKCQNYFIFFTVTKQEEVKQVFPYSELLLFYQYWHLNMVNCWMLCVWNMEVVPMKALRVQKF